MEFRSIEITDRSYLIRKVSSSIPRFPGRKVTPLLSGGITCGEITKIQPECVGTPGGFAATKFNSFGRISFPTPSSPPNVIRKPASISCDTLWGIIVHEIRAICFWIVKRYLPYHLTLGGRILREVIDLFIVQYLKKFGCYVDWWNGSRWYMLYFILFMNRDIVIKQNLSREEQFVWMKIYWFSPSSSPH